MDRQRLPFSVAETASEGAVRKREGEAALSTQPQLPLICEAWRS